MSSDATADDLYRIAAPRSDQLNADDLVGGRTVTGKVRAIKVGRRDKDPTIDVHIDGQPRPWRPCKGMVRLLMHVDVWGPDPGAWVGRSIRLHCDPNVTFGPTRTGGIRVLAVSHLRAEQVTVEITVKRGARSEYTVRRMAEVANTLQAQLNDLVRGGACTADQIRAALGGRKAAEVPPAEHAAILASLQPAREPGDDGGEE